VSAKLYAGDWMGSEVVDIASIESDGVAAIVTVIVFVVRLKEQFAI